MKKSNAAFYEKATQKLLKDVDSFGLSPIARMQARNFILLFRDSFKLESVKYATFYPYIGNDYKRFSYDSDGFCHAASAAFISLMPGEWQLMYINETWSYGPHFYIQHIKTKRVLDLTFDQYKIYNLDIPYSLGMPMALGKDEQIMSERFLKSTGINIIANIKNNEKD